MSSLVDEQSIDDIWEYSQQRPTYDPKVLSDTIEARRQERLKRPAAPASIANILPSPAEKRQSLRARPSEHGLDHSLFVSAPISLKHDEVRSPEIEHNASMLDIFTRTPRQALSFRHVNESLLDSSRVSIGDSMLGETTLASLPLHVDDPSTLGAPKLFFRFHSQFSEQVKGGDPLEMLMKYSKSCDEELAVLEVVQNQPHTFLTKQRLAQLRNACTHLQHEKHMWLLVHALYKDRLESGEDEEAMVTDYLDGRKSELEIMQALFARDSTVRQSQMVVDWCEQKAREKLAQVENMEFFSDIVCWENTHHELRNHEKMGTPLPRDLVTELDPDAAIRQRKSFAEDDKSDEHRLLRQVFAYVRAGLLDKAQDLCRKCGQAWRAADLDGWRLFHDPNFDDEGGGEVQGNAYRDVWKLSCWESANMEEFDVFERAIYAVLSGNLDQLLAVCESWEDCVWAAFKVLVDNQVEEEVRKCPLPNGRQREPLPENYGRRQLSAESIFVDLMSTLSERVQREGREPFHIIQRFVIVDDIDGLLEKVSEWIASSADVDHHLLRSGAHLILFFRVVGYSLPEEHCDTILHAFIKGLIKDQFNSLVATYTSCLSPPLQVQVYAEFLEGVTNKDKKSELLTLASKAGLDVALITKRVVENIRCSGTEEISLEASTQMAQTTISKADQRRIDAVDWLVFDRTQRGEAVRQACALIRAFLAVKKYVAARAVLEKIPSDSLDVIEEEWRLKAGSCPLPVDDACAARELKAIEAYLDALSSFDEWFRHYHHKKPAKPNRAVSSFSEQVALEQETKQYETELQRWEYTLEACTQDTVQRIYAVLLFPDGWMQDSPASKSCDASRQQQMVLLRQLCLPPLCFLLLSVLQSTNHGRECVQVADAVADEGYGIFKLFNQTELQKFLLEIQQACVGVLDTGVEDALGYD